MIVTPAGWLVIVLAHSILSAELVWARRWPRRIKKTGSDLARTFLRRIEGSSQPENVKCVAT